MRVEERQGDICIMRLIAVLAAAAVAASPAAAKGLAPETLAAILDAEGMSGELDDGESPAIYGESGGVSFTVFGFDCDPSDGCGEFVFNAYFDTDPTVTVERINDYNDAAIAGRAFLDDDGAANVEHFFTVESDPAADARENIGIWRDILADFAGFIGFYGDSAGS